jgi:hypothetical protein
MNLRPSRELIYATALGFAISLSATSWLLYRKRIKRKKKPETDDSDYDFRPIELRTDEVLGDITDLIGRLLAI